MYNPVSFGFRPLPSSPKSSWCSLAIDPCPHSPGLAKTEPGIYLPQLWPQPGAGRLSLLTHHWDHHFCQQWLWMWVLPPLQVEWTPSQWSTACPLRGRTPCASWARGAGRATGAASDSHCSYLKLSCFLSINILQIIVYSCFGKEDLLTSSLSHSQKSQLYIYIPPFVFAKFFLVSFSTISMTNWLDLCALLLSVFILLSSSLFLNEAFSVGPCSREICFLAGPCSVFCSASPALQCLWDGF